MMKYFVIRSFRGTCSCFEMLKWYKVRETLGTAGIEHELLCEIDITSRPIINKLAMSKS